MHWNSFCSNMPPMPSWENSPFSYSHAALLEKALWSLRTELLRFWVQNNALYVSYIEIFLPVALFGCSFLQVGVFCKYQIEDFAMDTKWAIYIWSEGNCSKVQTQISSKRQQDRGSILLALHSDNNHPFDRGSAYRKLDVGSLKSHNSVIYPLFPTFSPPQSNWLYVISASRIRFLFFHGHNNKLFKWSGVPIRRI